MSITILDFEKPIAEVSSKIEALQLAASDNPELLPQIDKLKTQEISLRKKIYSKLTTWQKVQVARHPNRPHTLDFIERIFDEFEELHGDRQFGDDAALVGGIAKLEGMPVMIIGHEKGRGTDEKVRRNFGMPQPEGYRKAKRLMQLAEQFNIKTGAGVVVTHVKPSSIAAMAGIEKGTVILQVNRKTVKNAAEFKKAIKTSRADKRVLLLIRNNDYQRYVTLIW